MSDRSLTGDNDLDSVLAARAAHPHVGHPVGTNYWCEGCNKIVEAVYHRIGYVHVCPRCDARPEGAVEGRTGPSLLRAVPLPRFEARSSALLAAQRRVRSLEDCIIEVKAEMESRRGGLGTESKEDLERVLEGALYG